jgi:hypothetical protein
MFLPKDRSIVQAAGRAVTPSWYHEQQRSHE